ncbi:MAG: hypothetical protein AMJ43_02190 [Coxiella sp. DG_40]|nr:MAG: hypothetical protein AMJ43_02190 [Coxiella sp. DG_40]
MFKNVKFAITLLLVVNTAAINAKVIEQLTWKDCLKEAKQNNPDLISAKEKINQAVANKSIARSDYLPELTSNLSGKSAKAADHITTDTYSYDINVKQLLFDGFKTSYDIASAAESIKSSQYNYMITSSNVRLNLRTAFIALLKSQQLLDITKYLAARRKQNLELVELRYKAGREHKGSLLNAEANFVKAKFDVTQAQRDIDLAQKELAKELGRRESSPIRAKGEFKVKTLVNKTPNFVKLANVNPLLLGLIVNMEAFRFNLKSAKADFFPKVYATASLGRNDSRWPPNNEAWSAEVDLSLPLFEGGSRVAQISKSRAELNQAQADLRSGNDYVVFTLERTWKELLDAIDKIEVEQKFLQTAKERARIAKAQYSTGLISFDDWSIIEDNLVTTEKSYLNVEADALVSEANWIQAKGGTLDYV